MAPIQIDVHVHGLTHEIEQKLDFIIKRMESLMATLDQVLADVTAESTSIDSVVALLDGLKQQLADALAGTTLPPAVQAKVDAIFASTEDNAGKIAKALAANVPVPPAV